MRFSAMSDAIKAGISNAAYGTLGGLVDNATRVRRQLDTLTEQASSGRVSTTYAGLAAGGRTSLDLSPQVATLQTWQNNISAAATTLQVAQTAMTQMQTIASDFNAKLNTLNGLDAQSVDSVAASARQALEQVAGLLDSQAGGVYVFGGQDSQNPPVPDCGQILNSGFYTQIAAAVGGLAANGAAATAAATLAVASSNATGTSPFSAAQSQAAATVVGQRAAIQTGDGQLTQAGLVASANAYVASQGPSTTGSYVRDLMRSLATLGSLSSTQISAGGFQGLVSDTRDCLTSAITAMAGDAGALGDVQSRLTATQTQLSATSTALTAQVSNVQDVDMAATLSKLSQVQTQLQSSYQLIASANSLSLVKYLSTG